MTGIVWFGLAVALALTGIGLLLLLPLAVFCAIDAARYRPHAARIRRSPLRLILLIVLLGMLVGLMALVM